MPVSFVFLVLVTFAIDAILMQFYDESLLLHIYCTTFS